MNMLMLSRADHQAISVSVIAKPRGWQVSLWRAGPLMPPDPGQGDPENAVWMNCLKLVADHPNLSCPVSLDGLTIHQQNTGWIIWSEQACLPVDISVLTRHHKILTSRNDAIRLSVRLWQINQPVLYSTNPGHILINQQTQNGTGLTGLPVSEDDIRQSSVCWSEPYNPAGSDYWRS